MHCSVVNNYPDVIEADDGTLCYYIDCLNEVGKKKKKFSIVSSCSFCEASCYVQMFNTTFVATALFTLFAKGGVPRVDSKPVGHYWTMLHDFTLNGFHSVIRTVELRVGGAMLNGLQPDLEPYGPPVGTPISFQYLNAISGKPPLHLKYVVIIEFLLFSYNVNGTNPSPQLVQHEVNSSSDKNGCCSPLYAIQVRSVITEALDMALSGCEQNNIDRSKRKYQLTQQQEQVDWSLMKPIYLHCGHFSRASKWFSKAIENVIND
ncbi:hypothetical protein T10_818 [Trichinella papuae]|uniref:Uncharacterized protein n=1 Tax=Trichinella papuae TaxID=268474 RepID=A0A0V1MVQ8_9BILA|nr:hypothetical protein T10_818 [Trichinella papuae]